MDFGYTQMLKGTYKLCIPYVWEREEMRNAGTRKKINRKHSTSFHLITQAETVLFEWTLHSGTCFNPSVVPILGSSKI